MFRQGLGRLARAMARSVSWLLFLLYRLLGHKRFYVFLWLAGCGALKLFFRVKVFGRENLPESGFIFVSRHRSAWDIIAMALAVGWRRPIRWVAREDLRLFLVKLLETYTIPINRERPRLSDSRRIIRALKKGEIIAIFPEGSRLPELQTLNPGVAWASVKTGTRIVPLNIVALGRYGYGAGSRARDKLWRTTRLELRIGPPLTPEELAPRLEGESKKEGYLKMTEELMERVDEVLPPAIPLSFREAWVACGRHHLYTLILINDPRAPSIFLSGPASSCAEHYLPLIKLLAGLGYNVIGWSSPGHYHCLKDGRFNKGEFRAKDLEQAPLAMARYARETLGLKGPFVLLLSSLSAVYGSRGLTQDEEGLFDLAFLHGLGEKREHIWQLLNKRTVKFLQFLGGFWLLRNMVRPFLFVPVFVRSSDKQLQTTLLRRYGRKLRMAPWAWRMIHDPSRTTRFTPDTWKSLIEVEDSDFRQINIPLYLLVMTDDTLFSEEIIKEFSRNLHLVNLIRLKGDHHIITSQDSQTLKGLVNALHRLILTHLLSEAEEETEKERGAEEKKGGRSARP